MVERGVTAYTHQTRLIGKVHVSTLQKFIGHLGPCGHCRCRRCDRHSGFITVEAGTRLHRLHRPRTTVENDDCTTTIQGSQLRIKRLNAKANACTMFNGPRTWDECFVHMRSLECTRRQTNDPKTRCFGRPFSSFQTLEASSCSTLTGCFS